MDFIQQLGSISLPFIGDMAGELFCHILNEVFILIGKGVLPLASYTSVFEGISISPHETTTILCSGFEMRVLR
jgi:hypothetical protein